MPDLNVLLAAIVSGGLGAAVLLLVTALRGQQPGPTRPPDRLRLLATGLVARSRSPLVTARFAAGLLLAVVVQVISGWPVAAVGLGCLVACWPALMGGSADERTQIARLEALVGWCESLRDTTSAHAGLEQAIAATAPHAAPPIRPALARLTGQLRAKVPLDQALGDLASDLDHSADLIIAALQMNATSRGDGLVGVLTNLAVAGREELDWRRTVTAGRAGDRRAMQLMLAIVGAVATFLVLFSSAYTAPYRTVAGQVVLAVVLGLFAASFVWIRALARGHPPVPYLPVTGSQPDPMEARIVATLTGPAPTVRAPAAMPAAGLAGPVRARRGSR